MARMALPNQRTLELKWNEAERVWIVRLLQGTVFITPRLKMTLQEFQTLFSGYPVELGEWVRLNHNMAELEVSFKKEWSVQTDWGSFMRCATQERPDPFEGWSGGVELKKAIERFSEGEKGQG